MSLLFDEPEAPKLGGALHNIYFAIQPDADAARTLCALGCADGHAMDPSRLHISLYSLGLHRSLPRQQVAEAVQAACRVRLPPFLVALDRVATWGRGRGPLPTVAWADEGVGGVRDLHDRLHEAVAPTAPWRRRKPAIDPHLTLWRSERRRAIAFIAPVRWWVREFVLLDSHYGEGRHEVLDRFPLIG